MRCVCVEGGVLPWGGKRWNGAFCRIWLDLQYSQYLRNPKSWKKFILLLLGHSCQTYTQFARTTEKWTCCLKSKPYDGEYGYSIANTVEYPRSTRRKVYSSKDETALPFARHLTTYKLQTYEKNTYSTPRLEQRRHGCRVELYG